MRIYFARHGESEANVRQVFSNSTGIHGLTENGKAQAEKLAERLSGVSFSDLYTSPILRAFQTATIVGQALGLACRIEDALREYDVGVLEGQPYTEDTQRIYWEVARQWVDVQQRDTRIEGGESHCEIAARFLPLIGRLQRQYGGTETNVVIISHGGTLRAMLPLLLDNIDAAYALEHPLGYTSCVIAQEGDGAWDCVQWGDDTLP